MTQCVQTGFLFCFVSLLRYIIILSWAMNFQTVEKTHTHTRTSHSLCWSAWLSRRCSCWSQPVLWAMGGLNRCSGDVEVRGPCSPRDSQESSPTPQFKSINSSALSFLHSPTLTSGRHVPVNLQLETNVILCYATFYLYIPWNGKPGRRKLWKWAIYFRLWATILYKGSESTWLSTDNRAQRLKIKGTDPTWS